MQLCLETNATMTLQDLFILLSDCAHSTTEMSWSCQYSKARTSIPSLNAS